MLTAMNELGEAVGIIAVWAMLLGPAIFGIAAVIFGLRLLGRAKQGGDNQKILRGFAALLLLAGFGVGTCYAVLFTGGPRWL